MKPSVIIRIIKAEGSTPREVGASMLVSADGFRGTIGGGTLEWHALAEAQKMLGQPKATKQIQKHLGPDLGQCCGGRVTLAFENFSAEDRPLFKPDENKKTHINLWGAGHVGRALVMALAPLPFDVTWWDVRDNAFPTLTPENTTCRIGTPTDMQTGGLVFKTIDRSWPRREQLSQTHMPHRSKINHIETPRRHRRISGGAVA
jgi:xanthine dehydrogenase accessory factor